MTKLPLLGHKQSQPSSESDHWAEELQVQVLPFHLRRSTMSISANGHLHDEANGGEDSDLESDFATAAAESGEDYYQPISAGSGSVSDLDSDSEEPDDDNSSYIQLNEANGNGVSSLDLNADASESESEQEESAGENEEEDKRRSLPLTQETSERIREVMRGIEFRGPPPPWADQLPEERWVDQLRRIRGQTSLALSPSSPSSS